MLPLIILAILVMALKWLDERLTSNNLKKYSRRPNCVK